MKRDPQESYLSGWDGNAGLPIQLYLHGDGELGVRPVPELESLRGRQLVALENVSLQDANTRLAEVSGTMLEIRLAVRVAAGERCGMKVRRSPDGAEETLIYYDARHATLNIDREKSSLLATVHQKGTQGGPLTLADGLLRLHIYLDQSMVEAYANDCKSITSRIYPSRDDATGLELWGTPDLGLRIDSLEIWEMGSAYNE